MYTYIYILLYIYGCVIDFYLLIVSKIIKKAHSDSVPLSIYTSMVTYVYNLK